MIPTFTGPTFEDEVRRIARARWLEAKYQGAAIIDNRERDGVFVTEDVVHLIECTTLRTKQKAEEDCEKLYKEALQKRSQYVGKLIKCWFITLDEPTPDQRKVVEGLNKRLQTQTPSYLVAVSLDQFRSELIDARSYLEARNNYWFGSMSERPKNGEKFQYTELSIVSESGENLKVKDISEGLLTGKRWVLLGDYGAGKSTTLREIYLHLRLSYLKNKTFLFPILINLRDHYGQTDISEVLTRHATRIGFSRASDLVRAWYGGNTILLLDGVDEIALPGWQGQAAKLRDLRHNSMEIIRQFVNDLPDNFGMIIAGRSNFFNDYNELQRALGISYKSFQRLNLNDFDEHQIRDYLSKRNWEKAESIPVWFPSRPLLLSYLTSNDLLDQTFGLGISPAAGWDLLLQRICEREARAVSLNLKNDAQIDYALDGISIRQLIERLASKARHGIDGVGPLPADEIFKTFREVFGQNPDDRSAVLIQRLPGLSVPNPENGSRSFVDKTLADAAKAGDVIRYAEKPYLHESFVDFEWSATMGELGTRVATYQAENKNLTTSIFSQAILLSSKQENLHGLCADLISIMRELEGGFSLKNHTKIKGVEFSEMSFDNLEVDMSKITYQNCLIYKLELLPDVNNLFLPHFEDCYIEELEGRLSEKDVPNEFFRNCSYGNFSNVASNNAAILELQLPLGLRVLMVVLRKLYLQSGSGRLESALVRGMNQEARSIIPSVLQILKRENLVIETKINRRTILLPVRHQSARVMQLLAAPNNITDTAITKVKEL